MVNQGCMSLSTHYLEYGCQLRDSDNSIVTIAVVRTRLRALPLTMITMRKSTLVFPFLSYMSMGLCLAALWAAGASL